MKPTRSLLALAFAAPALAGLGSAAPAFAGTITTPNQACQIFYSPTIYSGTVNHVWYLCPVVRSADSTGVTVYVDGKASPSYPANCSVTSTNYNGAFIAMKSFTRTDTFDHGVTLSATEAPLYAYLSVSCDMGVHSGGNTSRLFGVLTSD
jgi:hypothetical protein